MPCQVGITTDPERRRGEWQRARPTLHNWRIVETHYSKSAAQEAEIRHARAWGCNYGEGGGGVEMALWYVYSFDY